MSQPSPNKILWDFTPFTTAPAIKALLPPFSPLKAIPIPTTKIPSPLAENLAPHILLDLKESLCGLSRSSLTRPGSELGAVKGDEIWKCWKRAWDLWNGYYIEGRVDAGWVRGEYERIKGELERERARRAGGPYSQRQVNGYGHNHGNGNGDSNNQDNTDDDDTGIDLMSPETDTYNTDNLPSGLNPAFITPVDRGIPPVPMLRPAVAVAKVDGSTGGFKPMKILPDYAAPPPDEDGNYPEWEDVIGNTVWRPRRVGETTLSVGIDELWGGKSEFEFDGGVDCGRSPYPVLREIVEYIKHEGCFRKKKIWDRVTGTIFNMPTLPLDVTEITDERRLRMNALYGDVLRDEKPFHRSADYFPLDIRRVDKVDPVTLERHSGTPLLEDGEELVRWPWSNKPGYFQDLDRNDPWWVTDEQEELRDVPPRKYPPVKPPAGNGDILPIDDTIWQEEMQNDGHYRSRYFVTNLHGGTLVINGLQIRKGCIAGPLPDFAVIQTPGNQVSFWFGPEGRNWRAQEEGISYASQWAALRRMEGWEHVELTAGQVWDMKIRDRLRREYIGEDHEDDFQWAEWKEAENRLTPSERERISFTKSPLDVAIWNGPGTDPSTGKQITEPEFSTEEEELEWLLTRADPLKDVTPTMQIDNLLEPPEGALWPGPHTSARPDKIAQRTAQQIWDQRKPKILRQQRGLNTLLAEEKAARDYEKQQKIDAENRKRKAEGPMGPAAKKARFEAGAQSQAEQARRNAEALKAQEQKRKELERERERQKKLQDEAIIAAKLREAQAKAKKGQKVNEAAIRAEHKKQQEQERLERERIKKQLNAERAQNGQEQLPEIVPLTEEDAQNLADAALKKREEASRKRAEREKKRKELEAQIAALNQANDEETAKARAQDEAAAAARAVMEQNAKDREERRQRFIASQLAAAEKKKRDKAEAAARVETVRRANLFKEKYGLSPATGLELDDFGNYKFVQGLAAPNGLDIPTRPIKPPVYSLLDLSNMTSEELLEYAKRLSLMPPSPTKSFLGLSKMTYGQQLAYALQKSQASYNEQASEQERRDILKAMILSLRDPGSEASAMARLQKRAESEDKTMLEYVQARGFENVAVYIHTAMYPPALASRPKTGLPEEDPRNILALSRYWIHFEAQEGLDHRASREGRTADEIVNERGYENLGQYLQALENSFQLQDMPPAPVRDDSGQIVNAAEISDRWEAVNQRIADTGEWEPRIRALPRLGTPMKDGSLIYTVI